MLWSSRAEGLLVDHFRDLDTDEKETILVVDRCERSSTQQILEEAAARRRLKTILIREGSLSETGAAKLLVTPFEHDDTGKLVAELGRSWCEPSSWSSTRDPKTGKKSRAKTAKLVLGAMLEDMVLA